MTTRRIRTVAVAVCRAGDRILVERGFDRTSGEHFLRAIGGGVEFGERAADAVVREWREELGLELQAPVLLGVLENLFTYGGRAGHEVVLVFTARLADAWAGERAELATVEGAGERHSAVWVALDDVRRGAPPLYPAGLLDLIEAAH